MRRRKKSVVHQRKNTLHKRITLLVSFATITTFLLFLISSLGVTQPKQSVLGAAVNQLAMLINDGGGGGSTPTPTPNPYTCSNQAAGAGCYKYECPSNTHNIAGYCQMMDSECCAPGAPSPTPGNVILLDFPVAPTGGTSGKQDLSSPLGGSQTTQRSAGFDSGFFQQGHQQGSSGQGGNGHKAPPPTPTPTPSQQTQDIITYLNDQFNCSVTDANGNNITVQEGQQCPNSPYLCSNGYCAGLCTSNPSGCIGGSGVCQSTGMCQSSQGSQSSPTSVPQTTNVQSPTNTPIPQQQQTSQQTSQTSQQFNPPPQVPNTPIPPSQTTSQPNFFQSFFNTVPFFQTTQTTTQQTQRGGPTPTPGPLFQGTAALTGIQLQQEIQVQVTIKNGKLVIVAKRADGASVILSDAATQRLLQLMALGDLPAIMANGTSTFIIRTGDTEAVTSLPTSINLPFGTIIVTGPDGEDKQLALMPNDAVQAALQSQELNKVDRKQSLWDYILHGVSTKKLDTLVYITTLPNGVISYAVPGTITKRFIASFPIDISRTVYVSPDNGKVVQITENPISSVLDKVSVPYITSTIP